MQRLRFPGWTTSAIDWLIVVVLAGGAEYQIWVQPLDLHLRGARVANAVLFLLMVVPLGWRRRAPLLVLAIVTASTVVGFYALYDPASQTHPDPFLPFLIAIYSVAAHTDRRRATVGAALAAVAILAIDAPALLAGVVPNDVYAWLLYALAWAVGPGAAPSPGARRRAPGPGRPARARPGGQGTQRRHRRARPHRAGAARRDRP